MSVWFKAPGLNCTSVALALRAAVIAAARSKSPRPPRRETWRKCCWMHSTSPAEAAPEEALSATGLWGRREHSLRFCHVLCNTEMWLKLCCCLLHISPLRSQTPLLVWRGSEGNSSQVYLSDFKIYVSVKRNHTKGSAAALTAVVGSRGSSHHNLECDIYFIQQFYRLHWVDSNKQIVICLLI